MARWPALDLAGLCRAGKGEAEQGGLMPCPLASRRLPAMPTTSRREAHERFLAISSEPTWIELPDHRDPAGFALRA